jgi:hypothetical protein
MPRKKKDDVSTEKLIEVYREFHPRDAMTVASAEIARQPSTETVASAEIVRQPSTEDMKAMLDRLVKEKVEEALAERGADQFQPVNWSRRIRKVHPGFERDKSALYFEKWGCRICGRKAGVSHNGRAMCQRCCARDQNRMKQLELEWVRNNPESQIADDIDRLTRRQRTARALLGESEE